MINKGKENKEQVFVEIEIKGDVGSGKTLLLNKITRLLELEGYITVHPGQVREYTKEHSLFIFSDDIKHLEL